MSGAEPLKVGELLRRYRIQSGLTQEELAERAGLSARAIRALETTPDRAPRKDTLALLMSALTLTEAERSRLDSAMRQRRVPPATPRRRSSALRQPHIPFVGRQRERLTLERFLTGDAPPLLLLRGEPGIGKSRVLEEAVERAQELGWAVLAAGCNRRSAQDPYAPCVDALAHFLSTRAPAQQRLDLDGCAWLVRLLPELAERTVAPAPSWELPPQQERRLIFASVARFARNVAGDAGTLLILDDLHWAGADALDLLAYLLRETSARPVRILGAYRDTDVGAQDPLLMLLGDLARESLAASASLAPLEDDEAAQLLDILLADVFAATTALRQSIMSRAGGVPFYLVTCAQEAHIGGLAGQPEHDVAVPWSAAASIRQRLTQLSESAWDVLAIAAVMQRSTPRGVLLPVAEGLGHGEVAILRALESAIRARLLTENADGSFAFTHDLIRETLEADLSGARRAALHRRLADAMERLPHVEQRAAELAWHLARGDQLGRALPYAVQAGDLAEAVCAHVEAEQHYRAAVDWARQLGDRARLCEALDKRADVLFRLARFTDAYACLEETIRVYKETRDWERLAWATSQIAKAGDPLGRTEASLIRLRELFETLAAVAGGQDNLGKQDADDFTALERTAELAVSLLTHRTAARVYLCLTTRYLFLHRFDAVYGPSEHTVQHARAAGDRRIESLAHTFRAEAQQAQGLLAESAASTARARALAVESADLEALYVALRVEATNDELLAKPLRSHDTLARMLETATKLVDLNFMTSTLGALALNAFALGDWDTSTSYLERAAKLLHGDESTQSNAPAVGLSVLDALRSDHVPSSSGTLAELERVADERVRVWAVAILSELDLLAGRAEVAAARLQSEIERAQPTSASVPHMRTDTAWVDAGLYSPLPAAGLVTRLLVYAAWADFELGDRTRSHETLARARQLADSHGNRMALVDIERVAAMLALREGRWDEAEQALEQALAICLHAPYPYAEAKVRYLYGQADAAAGRPADARQQYHAALAVCARLGERRYRAHVERALALLPGDAGPAYP
jgi:transcriptional regulator with XRE-family HTH domain/tetratricopeptide (TPR) repeat protein